MYTPVSSRQATDSVGVVERFGGGPDILFIENGFEN
jgi:hypothetical protein